MFSDFAETEMSKRCQEIYSKEKVEDIFSSRLDRAKNCESDNVRQKINYMVADILGIPKDCQSEAINTLQMDWASEPSVSG